MPSGLSQSHQEIAGQFQRELLQLICLGSGGQHVQRPPPRGMGRPIGLQCPCNSFTRQEVRGASDSTNQRIENNALVSSKQWETPYTRIAEHLHLAPSSGNSLEAWTSYTVKLFISTNGSRRPHFTAAAGSEPATSRSEKGYCAKNERAPREQHISLEHLC